MLPTQTFRRLVGAVLAVCTTTAAVHADTLLDAVTPYLDESTWLVAYVDVSGLEPGAWLTALEPIVLKASVPADGEMMAAGIRRQFAGSRGAMDAMRGALLASGVDEFYLLGSFNTLGSGSPVVLVAPLAEDANSGVAANVFSGMFEATVVVENTLFAGTPAALAAVQATAAMPRPAIAVAFAATDADDPLRAVVAPAPFARRVLREMFPEIPAQLGGGSSEPLTEGLQWIALSAGLPAMTDIALKIKTADGAAATAMASMIGRMLNAMATGPLAARVRDADAFVRALKPEASASALVLNLDETGVQAIADQLMPAIQHVRNVDRRTEIMQNIRVLLVGCHMYAGEHDGDWVKSLADLHAKKAYIDAKILVNPMRPDAKEGFVYRIPPFAPDSRQFDASFIMIYASFDRWPTGGVVAGFADGHVEVITDEADFRQRIADS